MYLRKTTTAPGRGIDVLGPLYEQLMLTHKNHNTIDILQVGAGVGVKFLKEYSNKSKMVRRLDSLIRSFPLPADWFASYESMELYDMIARQGFNPRLRIADINPNVLSVVKRQQSFQQMAFELADISDIPGQFIAESYDVCVVLNVFPHLKCPIKKGGAARNLMNLTRSGGYLVGVPLTQLSASNLDITWQFERIDKLLYRKISTK